GRGAHPRPAVVDRRGLREGHPPGGARPEPDGLDHRGRRRARCHPRVGLGDVQAPRRPAARRPRPVPRRDADRRWRAPRAADHAPPPAPRDLPRRGSRHAVGPRARRGRPARAPPLRRARAADRRNPRRADRRPSRRPDPVSRPGHAGRGHGGAGRVGSRPGRRGGQRVRQPPGDAQVPLGRGADRARHAVPGAGQAAVRRPARPADRLADGDPRRSPRRLGAGAAKPAERYGV
ncbi:MAG: Mn-dependent transcriptional regulator MntR, partial [uncultured Solirubrobacteraceae bacterium]